MNFSLIIILVMMVGMMYFTSRQQKKQATERQNQLNALVKGEEVVTIGGMYALIDEIDQEAQKVVLDVEGVYLTFELSAIKRVVKKTSDTAESAVTSEVEADDAAIQE